MAKDQDHRLSSPEDLPPNKKRNFLLFSLYCIITASTLYLSVSAFFPLFVADHYVNHINTTMVAIILSSFEFAGVVSTPIHAVTISKMGRKNALLIGLLVLFLSTVSLGLMAYIDYDHWEIFFWISIVSRIA
jgi:MFS family permease